MPSPPQIRIVDTTDGYIDYFERVKQENRTHPPPNPDPYSPLIMEGMSGPKK